MGCTYIRALTEGGRGGVQIRERGEHMDRGMRARGCVDGADSISSRARAREVPRWRRLAVARETCADLNSVGCM